MTWSACSPRTCGCYSACRCGCSPDTASPWSLISRTPPSALGETGRLRLIVKDFDGALVHLPRLKTAQGPGAPDESAFADSRLVTTSDDALADVFITITVHLCAGALAFGLARRGVAPLPDLLALIRRELTAALDRDADWPAASLLRARVLDADRLPGKSMVTAGTLVAKSRTGASDINKFYGTNGPNYLKDAFIEELPVNPDALTAQSLLNCLVREVSLPEEQVRENDGHLIVRLARSDRLLRLGTRRRSAGPRTATERRRGDPARRRLAAGRLGRAHPAHRARTDPGHRHAQRRVRRAGTRQPRVGRRDHAGQEADNDGRARIKASRPTPRVAARYLSSEQALVAGHRFHPAPKARSGQPGDWLPFAPEAGARFPLRFLAVRREALDADGDTRPLTASVPRRRPPATTSCPLTPGSSGCCPGGPGCGGPSATGCSSTSATGRAPWSRPLGAHRLRPGGRRLLQVQPQRADHQLRQEELLVRAGRCGRADQSCSARSPPTWRHASPVPPCSASPGTGQWRCPT